MAPLYDAHCHPTDTMDSITELERLNAAGLCIMATTEDDQSRVNDVALEYEDKVIPCFGFHPWFVHRIYDDEVHKDAPAKTDHYKSVINPEPDDHFIAGMKDPVALSKHIETIRNNLRRHPRAMVGEVGLDRAFRIPDPYKPRTGTCRNTLSRYRTTTEHQAMVLKAQLALAAEFGRACSIHGVQAAGYLHTEIAALWQGHEKPSKSQLRREAAAAVQSKATSNPSSDATSSSTLEFIPSSTKKPFPPRICLHSYSGTKDMVRMWIKPTTPSDIFFSFSQVVNGRYDRWEEVVATIPDDRLLIESDYHDARLIDNSLQQAFEFVCKVKGWAAENGSIILERNWKRFVGLSHN